MLISLVSVPGILEQRVTVKQGQEYKSCSPEQVPLPDTLCEPGARATSTSGVDVTQKVGILGWLGCHDMPMSSVCITTLDDGWILTSSPLVAGVGLPTRFVFAHRLPRP